LGYYGIGGGAKRPNLPNEITVHTEGYYQPISRNGMHITWTGTQFEDGSKRGSAVLKQISPDTNFHIILETECITVNGNEAVYGGTITQIKALSGNAPIIEVGWRFYFKVDDYGLFLNGPNDQISNSTIFASSMLPLLCNSYGPNSNFWSSQGYQEVFSPGFVIVNN